MRPFDLAPSEDDLRYIWRLRRAVWFFGVLSLVIIPLFTIKLALSADLILYNLSTIANDRGLFDVVMLWGIVSALFYLGITGYLFMLTRYTAERATSLLISGCLMVIITVIIPFLPETMPVVSCLHILFAYASPAAIILTVLFFIRYLRELEPAIYRRSLSCFSAALLVCAGMIAWEGITSLVEVVFTTALSVILYLMLIWLVSARPAQLIEALREGDQRHADRQAPNP